MSDIFLLGSGKAATALGKAFKKQGHHIAGVWSRSAENAELLAGILQCPSCSKLSEVGRAADIYLVAVNDDVLAGVAASLKGSDKIIAHVSGIAPISCLKEAGADHGALYPCVSMLKEVETDFSHALFLVEGANDQTAEALVKLARSLSDNVLQVKGEQRQSMHLSAVFANNFTNHLYSIAEALLRERGLDFELLRPAIQSHIANVLKMSPALLQTGPAVRGDQSAIGAHLHLLEGQIAWKELYLKLTESIVESRKANNA